MNGLELDAAMRAVLIAVTRENVLRSTAELTKLGFNVWVAFSLVESCLKARETA